VALVDGNNHQIARIKAEAIRTRMVLSARLEGGT